ncbi:MAG: hypothetical protein KKC76_20725 [Proteobacteria bacterium]|nr:hypothetical protein [Pseudomonadota bacterium]MBU4295199.1 hypothetical protein [Pseudomonadota bacterium]MCG2749711.1 hypothetical protein [Desulfobulbaceae bacterium]
MTFSLLNKVWQKKCVFLLLLTFALPSKAQAAVIFSGVGNDGYFSDVQGVFDTLSTLPGLSTLSDQYLYGNLSGSAISASVTSLSPLLNQGDTLIWYYSGHGGWKYDGADHDESATGSFATDSYDEVIGLRYDTDTLTDDGPVRFQIYRHPALSSSPFLMPVTQAALSAASMI